MSGTHHPEPNRAAREAAEHVPSRQASRFFAAKHDLAHAAEQLAVDLRHADLGAPATKSFTAALDALTAAARVIADPVDGATQALDALGRDLGHVRTALDWTQAAGRVQRRLGDGHRSLHDRLDEAVDSVLWHLRAGDLGGPLIAAVGNLRTLVHDAEAVASST